MLRELTTVPSTVLTDSFDSPWKRSYWQWHRNLKILSQPQGNRHKFSRITVGNTWQEDLCWLQEELRLLVAQENGGFPLEKEMTIDNGGLGTEMQDEEENTSLERREFLPSQSNLYQNDSGSLMALLNACAKEKDLHEGGRVHIYLAKRGLLEQNIFLGGALVNMYAKCGALSEARQVFDVLPARNVITWNTLIAGYVQHGYGKEALECFEKMQDVGFSPNVITYVCMLKACGAVGALEKGQDIHIQILREHLLENHIEVANALVDMYAKCGRLDKAQEVFNELPVRSIVSWTALITGYAQHGYGDEALSSFEKMRSRGFFPDAITLSCILKACGSVGAFDKGQEIHALILRESLLQEDIVAANALIDMYAKCGALENAQRVFDELPARGIITWNTLIAGYAQHGYGKEALGSFHQMKSQGFVPDATTLACGLKACASTQALHTGQEIHTQIVREHLFAADTMVANSLIDMYAKCGALDEARHVFDGLSTRDVVSWNVLITGYDQHNDGESALDCFEQMQSEGFSPDVVTSACSLKACSSIGAAGKGQEVHSMIVKHGLLEKDMVVGILLVVMYGNCGMLAEADELLCKLPRQDVIAWSALLEGYAQLGEHEFALNLFQRMIGEGLELNWVTLVIVLNACSHGGLLEEGQILFESMSSSFGITPTLEHYACMVDLFCRAGHLDNAVALIEVMPLTTDAVLWHTLLGACQNRENTELGMWVFQSALHVDESDAGAYVSMSNMFSVARGQFAAL